MTDIILVCTIIVIALILFATEKLRIDFVAIMIMVALSLLGLFREKFPTPTEAVSGLSNTATVTVGAMFVLSAGLLKTGAVSWLSQRLVSFGGKSENLFAFDDYRRSRFGVYEQYGGGGDFPAGRSCHFAAISPQPVNSAASAFIYFHCRRNLHADRHFDQYFG